MFDEFKDENGKFDAEKHMAFAQAQAAILAEIEATAARSTAKAKLSSPAAWVKAWLAENHATIIRGQLTVNGKTLIEAKEECYVAACEARRLYNGSLAAEIKKTQDKDKIKKLEAERVSAFDNREFDAVIEVLSREAREKSEKEILAKILVPSPTDSLVPVTAFVRAITGRDDAHMESVALAHWMWGVKRKMAGLPVYYHLCPVIVGRQEGGKSSAILQLLAPLEHLAAEKALDDITDERSTPSLKKYYAVLIEEMSGSSRADVETLKAIITSPRRTYRPMRTNESVEIENKMSIIGTSNNPLESLIYDTTGMRRFVEIRAQDVLDWKTLNNMDIMAIWHSIDEARPQGYYHLAEKEIKAHQQTLIAKTPTQQFLDEHELTPGEVDVPIDELFQEFAFWCDRNRVSQKISKAVFSKQLMKAGFAEPKRIRTESLRIRVYSMNRNPLPQPLHLATKG